MKNFFILGKRTIFTPSPKNTIMKKLQFSLIGLTFLASAGFIMAGVLSFLIPTVTSDLEIFLFVVSFFTGVLMLHRADLEDRVIKNKPQRF